MPLLWAHQTGPLGEPVQRGDGALVEGRAAVADVGDHAMGRLPEQRPVAAELGRHDRGLAVDGAGGLGVRGVQQVLDAAAAGNVRERQAVGQFLGLADLARAVACLVQNVRAYGAR